MAPPPMANNALTDSAPSVSICSPGQQVSVLHPAGAANLTPGAHARTFP
mgnify:CR=1 FL=1